MPEPHARDHPAFVLVHGGFHGAWTWTDVCPLLARAGYAALAIDLPGAGCSARFPRAYFERPLDPDAFAAEPSPTAGVTQRERTKATVAAVRSAVNLGNGRVVLVGHSWGGLTISHAAEEVPELLHAVVYLTALLVRNGEPGASVFKHPSFTLIEEPSLFLGHPRVHGAAIRADPRSQDARYVAKFRDRFYHDVPPDRIDALMNLLHCEEPVDTAVAPMVVTAARFGTVPRHYIRMDDDRVLPAAAQDAMVAEFDATAIGGPTRVHELAGGHMPMFARPAALVARLAAIAG